MERSEFEHFTDIYYSSTMPKPSRRLDIIRTANSLFNEHGYHATGIDLIIREAKVSKKTLYTYFRSKEELILAALEYSIDLFDKSFIAKVEMATTDPKDKLLAIFDVSKSWFMQNNFYGCMFIAAVSEYPEENSGIRNVCQHYKNKVLQYIEYLCSEAGATDPKLLAEELALLLEGAIVTAQVNNDFNASDTAKHIAQIIINKYISE